MAVTIKDIARVAGVSHTTVSRALHDHPALSNETTRRIKELAEAMGYMPSATARGLKTRRSRALGVIVSHIDDPFWSEVLQGIDDVLHPAGYSLFVSATHRDHQREKEVVEEMVKRGVDGVILCAPQFSDDQASLLKSYGMPTAVVNNEGAIESEYMIFNDDYYGIRLVTRHLIEMGHRRIAFLGSEVGGRTTVERERGFRDVMGEAGLTVEQSLVHAAPEGTPEGGACGARYLLELPEMPSAIVCYNDNMAVGVYGALYQAGLRIPADVSVTGYDDITIARYLIPPLTTLHQQKYSMGAGAAKMLLGLLERRQGGEGPAPQPERERTALHGELVVRGSTTMIGQD